MSARARPTIFAATSCCASPSPSAPSRAPSLPRSPALANRPAPQQARQEAETREQRMPPLPRLQLNVGACMAVDLPCDVLGAAGEGQASFGQPHQLPPLAATLELSPCIQRRLSLLLGAPHVARKARCFGELPITRLVHLNDRIRARRSLRA